MKSSDIIPAIRTDHDAISIEISELENEQKGPGYWKMNRSILKDEEYVNNVTELLPLWTAEGRKKLWTVVSFGIGSNIM